MSIMRQESQLVRWVYFSRGLLIISQFFWNHLIPDHNAHVFLYPAPKNKTTFDTVVDHTLGGLLRWDAQYFMHIAKYGYTYENVIAFFPLYPLTVGFISETLAQYIGHSDSIILITFIIVNVILFKKCTLILYRLTEKLFNRNFAFEAAKWFCFNPASVFFIAPYTETLFCFLTFSAILGSIELYEKYSKSQVEFSFRDLVLLLPTALSTITRSNGLVNIGFPLYVVECLYLKLIRSCKMKFNKQFQITLRYSFLMLMIVVQCALPFALFQYYCYERFCGDFPVKLPEEIVKQAAENRFVLPGNYKKHQQSWCKDFIPLAYSYVQKHYWDVGFMKYYQVKQWPNFVIASPILFLVLFTCLRHFYVNVIQRKSLGVFTMENPKGVKLDLFQPRLHVFYVHAFVLTVFCMFFIHIQVSVRFLSSASPLLYWICAKHITEASEYSKHIKIVFIGYFAIGTILFSNFLPWT